MRRRMGMLFQNGALLTDMSVFDNVAFPLRERTKLGREEIAAKVRDKLQLFSLDETVEKKFPAELSGGMRKRVGLARALALDPELLFLDEPTAGLDPIAAAAFDDLLLYLRDSLDLTVVMVTHDLDTLVRTCDRVGVLVDGKVIVDTLQGIVANDHPWIRQYFHGERGRAALSQRVTRLGS